MKIIRAEWLEWIKVNKERQCSSLDIFTHLVNEGYDPEESFDLVFKDNNTVYHSKKWLNYETSQLQLDGQSVNVLFEYQSPEIVLFGNFLSEQECDYLMDLSANRLLQSTVVDNNKNISHDARTSNNAYYKQGETSQIVRIENRISKLLDYSLDKCENLQVLKYTNGAQYKPHQDFFSEVNAKATSTKNGGQRIGTFIIYLNDVSAGGETCFPHLGINIKPKKGNALFFSYTNDDNQSDERTLHGGNPVLCGEKWIATMWLRQHKIMRTK